MRGQFDMGKNKKWKSQFIVVALGQAISMLGSQGVQFALIWWLAEKTSSPLMLGISGIVAYLPMSLFSPIAGIAADRYNRKFISIFSDMTMGMIALIYAVLLFFLDLPVWTVFVMLCVRGIGSTFQQPAIQSIIPQLVPKDQLVKTNGWMQLLNSGSFLLAEEDEQIIGFVLVQQLDTPPYACIVPHRYTLLMDIVVSDLYRGQGIGRALIEEAKLWSKRRGSEYIELSVVSQNRSATAMKI